MQRHSSSAARRLLYNLFRKLQADFNGDIFDDDLTTESRLINDSHIEILSRFLNGETATGQMSLASGAYDFSIIPIETISAIYEQFLGAEDEEDQQESGVRTRLASWQNWRWNWPGTLRNSRSGQAFPRPGVRIRNFFGGHLQPLWRKSGIAKSVRPPTLNGPKR